MANLQLVRLFVYGTLKSGEPNHYILSDRTIGKARLITKAKTKQKYPLVVASDYNLPFLLPVPGKGEHVEGEVYEVDQAMLQKLDELEAHPKVYLRTPVQCVPFPTSTDAKEIDCETYFLPDFKNDLLDLPFHKSFIAYPKHPSHHQFVPRNMREDKELYISQVKNMDS